MNLRNKDTNPYRTVITDVINLFIKKQTKGEWFWQIQNRKKKKS